MKHTIEFKTFEPQEAIHQLVERLIAKLEKRTKAFSTDAVFLRIFIENNQVRTLYNVSITLQIPGKTLATREERHDIDVAIKDAFTEIERQLKENISKLRGEHLWKRLARRAEIRQMRIGTEPDEQRRRDIFFSLVSPHLDKLNHLVGRVIHYSEASGELVRGELEPEDVVDATLIRAYREFLQGYPSQDFSRWLIRAAMDVLDGEVTQRVQEHERTVHIEEDVPETPPTVEASTLGDEILDFYQPDEDLKVEDIVPDIEVPTPEQITETRELQRHVRGFLAQMPEEWRRALLLHDILGRSEADVAKAIGKRQSEVARILERAREHLRQKLTEYGYGIKRAA